MDRVDLHLAGAAEVGTEVVTADGKLARGADSFGVTVLHVQV